MAETRVNLWFKGGNYQQAVHATYSYPSSVYVSHNQGVRRNTRGWQTSQISHCTGSVSRTEVAVESHGRQALWWT